MQRKTTVASIFVIAVLGTAAAAFAGCTSVLGDFEVNPAPVAEAGADAPSLPAKANGEACAAGGDCTSGFCTDGVCCESSCDGVCETCGLDKGKCTSVPDGQDPDKECVPEPAPDAGTPEPDAEAPPGDGGASDAAAADDGAAGAINFPDGGVTRDEAACAGSCNGARACKYPGTERACGSKFCNTGTEAARYACNSKGRCGLDLQTCASFTCENDECRKTCAEQNDCQPTHFCNPSGLCQERLADGLGCTLADQCKSGFCVVEGGGGVCCNSGCDPVTFGPGSSCKTTGSVGKCKCSVNCGAGSCRLFYKDFDGDTFGDRDGNLTANTAVIGCDNAAPPATFVADKTDCDDKDARAKPGQSGWFADTTIGKGLNDFNCDGAIQKEIREYAGESCQFCTSVSTACISETTCRTAGAQSRLTCAAYKDIFLGGTGVTCGYSKFASNTAGFTSTVACGASPTNAYRTCGTCTTKSGLASSTTSTVQQRCH